MLIPISHENMQGRRWPYVTIAIILMNLFVFLGTHWKLEKESKELATVKVHILLLAAAHPDAQMTPEVKEFVESFEHGNPKMFAQMKSPYRQLGDGWDARMRMFEPEQVQPEMDALAEHFAEMRHSSILEKYAFTPSHPRALAYVTSTFLHGGWLHLIFNMWFLWLAGSKLEDTWGRAIYPLFYLVAGFLATVAHQAMYPDSIAPSLGASGAVAGLMGAFLVRFPTTKIQMAWLIYFRLYKFRAPAYTLLPLWLLTEIFYGSLFGHMSGVAHWAHVGGFVFGAAIARLLRVSGIEHAADKAIEAKVTWTADPRLVKATECLEKNQVDPAITQLKLLLAERPDSVETHNLLLNAYWRKQDLPAHTEELATLCRMHVNAREMDEAWQRYEEFTTCGGQKLHKAVWMELCRFLESRQNWDRATSEYEKLAAAYPKDRIAISALLAAARVQHKELNNHSEALRLYRAAEASPAPHLDLDATIRTGLQDLGQTPASQTAQQPVQR